MSELGIQTIVDFALLYYFHPHSDPVIDSVPFHPALPYFQTALVFHHLPHYSFSQHFQISVPAFHLNVLGPKTVIP